MTMADVTQPRGYLVAARRCDECLYGPNALVSQGRRAQILHELEEEDGWFACHKNTGVRCRGDYEHRRHARCDRLAAALNLPAIFIEIEEEARHADVSSRPS